MKKELELINVQHESAEASLKKRHQEILNDLQDQLEKASKTKSKYKQTDDSMIRWEN